MLNLQARFDCFFAPRAVDFASAVGAIDPSGIPEPHLPHWGSLYENAPLKIGVIGRDTRSWGEMKDFLDAVRVSSTEAVNRGRNEFDSLEFTNWTNNFGTTFWDTSLKILAGLHGIADWKRLKRREEETILRSFLWANVNSVERYEVTPKTKGVPYETWRQIKDASEQHFDSFNGILNIFHPDIVILMNWDRGEKFMDVVLDWEEFGDHLAYAFCETTKTHIFMTAHPTWLNQNYLYDGNIAAILSKAHRVLEASGKNIRITR